MKKRMIIMLIAVGLLLGGVFGWHAFVGQMIKTHMAGMGNQPQTISTTVAGYQDWRQQLQAVGSLRAAKGVDISSEMEGVVAEIHFDSGADVKEGTLLVKLRADDDIAHLHSLEAAARLANTTYRRDLQQLKVQAVSQAVVDADAANLSGANAQVAQQQAIVDKKFIKAPFSGHLGIRNVDLGQYLTAGTNIVTLQQLDPVYLDFFLPQQAVAEIKAGQAITVKNDAYAGKVFNGKIAAINPKVDTATRNVQVRAELANPDHALLPGMYATADIETGEPERTITLPQTAITYNAYGNTVFLVEEKGKNDKGEAQFTAKQTFVTTGDTRGDQVAILKGVSEGDTVVTSGQVKLQNGSPLRIDNSVQPGNDANPQPKDF